jgi:hypothetical protein
MRDFLHSAESKPPAHVMTVVSGRGYPTVDRLITPALLGAPAALGKVNEGDGVITRASAEGGFPVVESVVAGHSDLPRVLAMTGRLAKMVLEERAPPDPPPPPVISSTVEPIHLQGPPLPGLSTPVSLILCSGGRCGC